MDIRQSTSRIRSYRALTLYVSGYTYDEIANATPNLKLNRQSVSRERARQLCGRAVRLIQRAMPSKEMKEVFESHIRRIHERRMKSRRKETRKCLIGR